MNIKGKIVTLRAVEEEDLEMLRSIMNDPEVEYLMAGWTLPISKAQQKKWYEKIIYNREELRLIIETNGDGAVGVLVVSEIDWKNRVCLLHGVKIVNKNHRTKGIGTDAIMAIMRYCFEELQLNRIEGVIVSYNQISQNYVNKLGWSIEGRSRKAIYKNGQYNDLIHVGILKEDYYSLINKTQYWDK